MDLLLSTPALQASPSEGGQVIRDFCPPLEEDKVNPICDDGVE